MRYHMLPRDARDAADHRRDMARRAQDAARARLERATRRRARVRLFGWALGLGYALVLAAIIYLGV